MKPLAAAPLVSHGQGDRVRLAARQQEVFLLEGLTEDGFALGRAPPSGVAFGLQKFHQPLQNGMIPSFSTIARNEGHALATLTEYTS
jgi:hypothetical protein